MRTIELEEDLTDAGDGVDGRNGDELDDEHLALLDLDLDLLANGRLGEEVARREVAAGRAGRKPREKSGR